MTKAPVHPPWHITLNKKYQVIAEFDVPAHKMGHREVATFLRAIVIRHRTATAEDMASYYVNNRRGQPNRLPFAEVIRHWSDDHQWQGYFCGEWELYATAMQDLGPEMAKIIRGLVAQNLAASNPPTI